MSLPLLVRAFAVAIVAFVLLVPISLIEGKIHERQSRSVEVLAQFERETTGAQVLAGPLLALTCEETYVEEREIKRGGKAETVSERRTRPCPTAFFPPRALNINGKVPVESRHRGIYQIRVYRATLDMTGDVEWPASPLASGGNPRAWKHAYLVTAVSDPRGIKSVRSATSETLGRVSDENLPPYFAIQEELGDYASRKKGSTVAFDYKLELAGISSLHIAPVGDSTGIRLASGWPHPSFSGGWSPDERSVDASGFQALWRTTHLATGGQAFWEKLAQQGKLLASPNAAGVSLIDPINVYSLSYRATEYGFLFILFTFASLALVEVLAGIRLHPIQYALVGSALAVFFLLLIALSEHIVFQRAYASAAAACVVLLTLYLRHALASLGRTAAMFTLFCGLYGALYVLLLSEDHALLLGSVMVFTLLAVVMLATRKLDWSELAKRMAPSRKAGGTPAPRAA